MIVYCIPDLIFATKVKGTADAIGAGARPVRSIEQFEARLEDEDVRALIVEVGADASLDLLRAVRERGLTLRTLAYGPHVEVEALSAAGEAGAEAVLTRGQFAGQLAAILHELDRPLE